MTKTARDALLDKVLAAPKPANTPPHAGASSALQWDVIGRIVEGLAFGQRPISAAAREITNKYDLGPRGAFILSLISGGLSYPLELATALKIGRSLITAELTRLTDSGLVTATPDAQDRRRSALALTPEGEQACADVRAAMDRIIRRNLAGYSIDEMRLFTRMLHDVRMLDKDEAESSC